MDINLVARFIASVDIEGLPTNFIDLEDFDYSDLSELKNDALHFPPGTLHDNEYSVYVVPDTNSDDTGYIVKAYTTNDDLDGIQENDYIPTWDEISDELKRQKLPYYWVDKSRVDEVLKKFPTQE